MATCGIAWISFVRCPPRFAYQVWLWTIVAPSAAADMARSIETARSAARGGALPTSSSQGWWATTGGRQSAGRGSPQQWTVTSTSFASSRARYSTCTPAPP